MNNSLKRISEEFKDLNRNFITNCGVTVSLFNEEDIRNWRVTILGAKNTSYKGGLFYLSVNFPFEYPEKPPEVCFITPIYHVNVNPKAKTFEGGDSLGHVCMSSLFWWKKEYTMREILTNIFGLFYFGNPDSCYDLQRSEEFRNNRNLYEQKVKFFTKKYANPLIGFKSYPLDKDWDFTF